MQARKRTFFEEFTVAFSKPALWEKCRELSRILPFASPNELHAVFPQICGDVFGYGAGGRHLLKSFSRAVYFQKKRRIKKICKVYF